jgi:hypothetical protein
MRRNNITLGAASGLVAAAFAVGGCSSSNPVPYLTVQQCAHTISAGDVVFGVEPLDTQSEVEHNLNFAHGRVLGLGYFPACVVVQNNGDKPATFIPSESLFEDRIGGRWSSVSGLEFNADMKLKPSERRKVDTRLTLAFMISPIGAAIGMAMSEPKIEIGSEDNARKVYVRDVSVAPHESARGILLLKNSSGGAWETGGSMLKLLYEGGKMKLVYSVDGERREANVGIGAPRNFEDFVKNAYDQKRR